MNGTDEATQYELEKDCISLIRQARDNDATEILDKTRRLCSAFNQKAFAEMNSAMIITDEKYNQIVTLLQFEHNGTKRERFERSCQAYPEFSCSEKQGYKLLKHYYLSNILARGNPNP